MPAWYQNLKCTSICTPNNKHNENVQNWRIFLNKYLFPSKVPPPFFVAKVGVLLKIRIKMFNSHLICAPSTLTHCVNSYVRPPHRECDQNI